MLWQDGVHRKHSMSTQGAEQRKSVPCAFCRAPPEADLYERMQRLESRAAKNDSRAHFELAGYYFLGRASRVDVDMGVTHVNAALDLGCAQAQFHYGMFYQNGCWAGTHVPGVRIDLARAADLYTLAAEQGHDHAGMNLQLMLLGGGPGSAAWDPGRAMGMLHRLAEEHHSTYAHHRLGCIYHSLWPPSGPVVEKSAKQAISHYRVTAEMPSTTATCQSWSHRFPPAYPPPPSWEPPPPPQQQKQEQPRRRPPCSAARPPERVRAPPWPPRSRATPPLQPPPLPPLQTLSRLAERCRAGHCHELRCRSRNDLVHVLAHPELRFQRHGDGFCAVVGGSVERLCQSWRERLQRARVRSEKVFARVRHTKPTLLGDHAG